MDVEQCLIDSNPDMIGIGIRISIYILSLSSEIIHVTLHSAPLSASIELSLGVTGLALLLTTIIQTALGGVALFHALCVLHLLGLVGMSVQPKGKYRRTLARDRALLTLYVFAMSGSVAYFIYVFANAPHFGNQPECNKHTKYVLFGVDIQATNVVIRWIFVAVLGCFAVGLLVWLVVLSGAVCCMGFDYCRGRRRTSEADVETGSGVYESEDAAWGRILPLLGHLGARVYLIVMLELIIKRNELLPGIAEWTFGQVLAIMMLIGPVIELLSLILGMGKLNADSS